MKKFTLLCAGLFLLVSCNSDDNDLSASNNLKGKWNWIRTTGGFGSPSSADPSNQKVIEFSGNSLITYQNGTLSTTQKFFIQKKKSVFGGDKKMIVIDKGNSITQEYYFDRSFEIVGSKLYLKDECVDCATVEYERIK
jgi:hypothetical protein